MPKLDLKNPGVQKLALSVMMSLGVLGVFFFSHLVPFSFQNQRDRVNALKAEYEKKSTELARARATVSDLPRFEAEYEHLHERWAMAAELLPADRQLPVLLRRITLAAQQTGVEFVVFRPNEVKTEEHYVEMPMQLSVYGGYHQIGSFIAELANMRRIVTVSGLQLKTSKADEESTATTSAPSTGLTATGSRAGGSESGTMASKTAISGKSAGSRRQRTSPAVNVIAGSSTSAPSSRATSTAARTPTASGSPSAKAATTNSTSSSPTPVAALKGSPSGVTPGAQSSRAGSLSGRPASTAPTGSETGTSASRAAASPPGAAGSSLETVASRSVHGTSSAATSKTGAAGTTRTAGDAVAAMTPASTGPSARGAKTSAAGAPTSGTTQRTSAASAPVRGTKFASSSSPIMTAAPPSGAATSRATLREAVPQDEHVTYHYNTPGTRHPLRPLVGGFVGAALGGT